MAVTNVERKWVQVLENRRRLGLHMGVDLRVCGRTYQGKYKL